MQCVGWYHSHPTFPVLPSTIDVYNQHTQQVAHSQELPPGASAPYVAAIVGPYDVGNTSAQSHMSWFYVENRRSEEYTLDQAPEACLHHMVPKLLNITMFEEASGVAAAAQAVALPLIQRYAGYKARTDFTQVGHCVAATAREVLPESPDSRLVSVSIVPIGTTVLNLSHGQRSAVAGNCFPKSFAASDINWVAPRMLLTVWLSCAVLAIGPHQLAKAG
jgi:hypothetical protein